MWWNPQRRARYPYSLGDLRRHRYGALAIEKPFVTTNVSMGKIFRTLICRRNFRWAFEEGFRVALLKEAYLVEGLGPAAAQPTIE